MEASIEKERATLKAKQREIEMQMAEEAARAVREQDEMMRRNREEMQRRQMIKDELDKAT